MSEPKFSIFLLGFWWKLLGLGNCNNFYFVFLIFSFLLISLVVTPIKWLSNSKWNLICQLLVFDIHEEITVVRKFNLKQLKKEIQIWQWLRTLTWMKLPMEANYKTVLVNAESSAKNIIQVRKNGGAWIGNIRSSWQYYSRKRQKPI